uniref:Ubiquitin-like domain-containing protein n=1 Tax=Plectus sambesii TaxID=2011161 RepID=A0A914X6U0_9BILA
MSDQHGESKVVIRCALQSFPDTTVICPHDWTVRRLKEHLRDVCSGEPCPDRQRLIYAGQCLSDERTLGTVLRRPSDPDGSQVIHMVCPLSDKLRLEREADLRRRKPVVTPAPTAAAPTMAPTNWAGMYAGMTPQVGGSMADWQQAQQQMYHAYMATYANYMQQMFGALGSSPGFGMATPFPTFVPVTPPQTPVVAAGPAPNAFGPDQVPAPAPAPVVAPAEPPMNAQGGVAQDEDDLRERDWLDWIYTGIRAALLLTVIYFYTTPERLLGVALFILAMWAAQGGWNNFRRVQQPNNNNNAQQPAAGNVPVDE